MTELPITSPGRAFALGAIDSLPLVVAAAPFGILFGALAPANDIPGWIAVAFSALVFAGSAQYVALGLLAIGTPLILIVLTTFVVNLRHLLYSLALAKDFQFAPRGKKIVMAFFLTDETFVTVSRRLQMQLSENHRIAYYFGSACFMYGNWQVCTWMGLWAGSSLQNIEQLGLEFAMVAAFIGMLVPMLKHKANVLAAIIGFALAWFTRHWPYQSGLVFSVVVAALVASYPGFNKSEKALTNETCASEGSVS